MKRFFKYFLVGFGTLLILLVIGFTIWWNAKSNREKSDFFLTFNDFERAIKYDQNNSEAWMEYSVQFNKAGDFEKGFHYLDKAVELDPKLHLGYRAWIRLRKMRDYDKALIDFDKLDNLTPNFVDAPWGEDIDFLRGECYFGKKEYKKAIELFNRNIENKGEDWTDIYAFVYLGLCQYELGNYKESINEFQRALTQSTNIPESYFGMAKSYQKLGEIAKAKENILKSEAHIGSKRNDVYNELLNEIYLSEILAFKEQLIE